MSTQRTLYPPEKQFAIWQRIRGPFLLPPKFEGHTCEWETFSCMQAGCLLCGAEHKCSADNAECDTVRDDDGHVTCSITGAVVRENELRDEWGAPSRAHVEPPAKRAAVGGKPAAARVTPCWMWTFVNQVVRKLLDSDTTEECRSQENRRLCTAMLTAMHREMRRQLEATGAVNMVPVAAAAAWHTRKMRHPIKLEQDVLEVSPFSQRPGRAKWVGAEDRLLSAADHPPQHGRDHQRDAQIQHGTHKQDPEQRRPAARVRMQHAVSDAQRRRLPRRVRAPEGRRHGQHPAARGVSAGVIQHPLQKHHRGREPPENRAPSHS